ncbi:hypothetical protein niasHT_034641 [Heterodera trifolii]|uniref:Uncharacterized protein n=1 Tax=Heterodera trifolii TaxID=157864 RepID=A0ABD2IZ03_9BILA
MQLLSNAILLLLLAAFAHCTPPPSFGKPNRSTNGTKTKSNPQNSAGVLPSLAKVATGVLAVSAMALPGADCASRQFGHGKQAETAMNSVDTVDLPLAQPASAPTQSFSPNDFKTPPGKQEMRRRMTKNNKPINAVQHRGDGGGSGGSNKISPPSQQEIRRRIIMNKQITAVEHIASGHGGGGGGHGGGGGGGSHGSGSAGGHEGGVGYNPSVGARGSNTAPCKSNNCKSNDQGSWDCCC